MSRHIVLSSRRETVRLGRKIAAALRPGDLVLLRGPLGAGKTFLARAVLHALGVTGAVPSPTFGLVHEYASAKGELLHADFYRLLDERLSIEDAVAGLGLRERRALGAMLLAEWAETCEASLGAPAELSVTLELAGQHARDARIEGPRSPEVA